MVSVGFVDLSRSARVDNWSTCEPGWHLSLTANQHDAIATLEKAVTRAEALADRRLVEALTDPTTGQVWWPEIEAFLQLNITNARTEGSHRTIKQIKRVACGFANQANYERRILAYATRNAA